MYLQLYFKKYSDGYFSSKSEKFFKKIIFQIISVKAEQQKLLSISCLWKGFSEKLHKFDGKTSSIESFVINVAVRNLTLRKLTLL